MVNAEHVAQTDINQRLVSIDLWMYVSPVPVILCTRLTELIPDFCTVGHMGRPTSFTL